MFKGRCYCLLIYLEKTVLEVKVALLEALNECKALSSYCQSNTVSFDRN